MNRLLKIRTSDSVIWLYLRVLINEYFDETTSSALIDKYTNLIDAAVQTDPKKGLLDTQFTGRTPWCFKTSLKSQKHLIWEMQK